MPQRDSHRGSKVCLLYFRDCLNREHCNGFQCSASTEYPTHIGQVLVPVVVTENSGHYALDLKASDFQFHEDGWLEKLVAYGSKTPVDHQNRVST